MGKIEATTSSHIIKFKCSACRINIIYIKAINHEINDAPFKANEYVCSECTLSMKHSMKHSKTDPKDLALT